jgi:hypothetical protein
VPAVGGLEYAAFAGSNPHDLNSKYSMIVMIILSDECFIIIIYNRNHTTDSIALLLVKDLHWVARTILGDIIPTDAPWRVFAAMMPRDDIHVLGGMCSSFPTTDIPFGYKHGR